MNGAINLPMQTDLTKFGIHFDIHVLVLYFCCCKYVILTWVRDYTQQQQLRDISIHTSQVDYIHGMQTFIIILLILFHYLAHVVAANQKKFDGIAHKPQPYNNILDGKRMT